MGRGTFAKVVQCWDRKHENHVAIKIVRSAPKYTDAAKIEIDILRDVNGQCGWIELIDWFTYREHSCLVFPKYDTSLFDFIKMNDYRGFYLSHVKKMARQMLIALRYLHEKKKLVHTDLKPENILLERSDYFLGDHGLKVPKYTDIKLIDLGSATYEDQDHASIISTRHYRAPEVLLGMCVFVCAHSFELSLFSMGNDCVHN